MTDDLERVMSRIRKMLALANDAAASEGERDNALRMVHATLAKHNLSMAEAQASGQTQEEKRIDSQIATRSYPWMRRSAHAIAELMFCKYFFSIVNEGKTARHYSSAR